MAEIRLKGPAIGQSVNLDVQVGSETTTIQVPAFQEPSLLTSLPRITGSFDDETLGVDTGTLTNVAAYDWREVGGASLGTDATLDASGHGGKWIEVEVTAQGGAVTSPPVMVYASSHMGMAMPASHIAENKLVLSLCPHTDVTHLAIADGLWSDPGIWLNGQVPGYGARVLIPHARVVTYDNTSVNRRLDWVRVDGTLTWSRTHSTQMLVETLIATRGSDVILGTEENPIPPHIKADIIFGGRYYRNRLPMPSDLNIASDTGLWGRGAICMGRVSIHDVGKRTWGRASAGVPQGATQLTLTGDTPGWSVGDTIVISGTKTAYSGAVGERLGTEDEARVITAINGNVISWAEPLVHSHENQLLGSSRTDLHPTVMLKGGRNICLRSEVTEPVWRRGHFVNMGHHAVVDINGGEYIDLGRTDKSRPAGIKNDVGDFEFSDPELVTLNRQTEPFTERSNIQGRYSIHLHHVNQMMGRARVANTYTQGVPGWGNVQHGSEADFVGMAVSDFWGAGIVSEDGSETGTWIDCFATSATIDVGTLFVSPKTKAVPEGIGGDTFRHGFGFGMRGRALVVRNCVAAGVPWSHVFFHRSDNNANNIVVQIQRIKRSKMALKEVGQAIGHERSIPHDEMMAEEFPILTFTDCEAIACLGGMFVTKQKPNQRHDVNVRIQDFRAWGVHTKGMEIEYVNTYRLKNIDCIAGEAGIGKGIELFNNLSQVGTIGCRVEGFAIGIERSLDATFPIHDNHDSGDPRWFDIGTDYVRCAENEAFFTTGLPAFTAFVTKPANDVFYQDHDYDGTALDYDRDPISTFPFEIGVWDGVTTHGGDLPSYVTNADGYKEDNLSATAYMAPKPSGDLIFCKNITGVRRYKDNVGFWEYDGNPVIVMPTIFTDRLTGRPFKFVSLYRCLTEPTGTNNGLFTYAPTPVVQSNKTALVDEGGTVVIDVIDGASGAGGPGTYSLDVADHIPPNGGEIALDEVAGTVTYTPHTGFTGPDEMYVFVKSQGRFATVRINILVGAAGIAVAPASGTDFSAMDHVDPGILEIALAERPDTGGRRITRTEYSTDGGATWRRLCNRWIEATHTVAVASDGASLSAGSYMIQTRYRTDFDHAISAASDAAPVTIS